MVEHYQGFTNIDNNYVAEHFLEVGNGLKSRNSWFDQSDGPQEMPMEALSTTLPNGKPPPEDPKKIRQVTQRAEAFLDSCARKAAIFLEVSHYAVHSSIESTDSSLVTMKSRQTGERHKHADFAITTRDLDQSLGKIMDKLEELHLLNNTYLITCRTTAECQTSQALGSMPKLNHPLQAGKWDAGRWSARAFDISGPDVHPRRMLHATFEVVTSYDAHLQEANTMF